MAVAQIKLADTSGVGMDRHITPTWWTKWPLGARVASVVVGLAALAFTVIALVFGGSASRRTCSMT